VATVPMSGGQGVASSNLASPTDETVLSIPDQLGFRPAGGGDFRGGSRVGLVPILCPPGRESGSSGRQSMRIRVQTPSGDRRVGVARDELQRPGFPRFLVTPQRGRWVCGSRPVKLV